MLTLSSPRVVVKLSERLMTSNGGMYFTSAPAYRTDPPTESSREIIACAMGNRRIAGLIGAHAVFWPHLLRCTIKKVRRPVARRRYRLVHQRDDPAARFRDRAALPAAACG